MAFVAIGVAGNEDIERAVDALLPKGLPGCPVGLLLVRRAVGVHAIDERADETVGTVAGEAMEGQVPRLCAEAAAIAVEGIEMIIVGPERVPGVAVGIVPFVDVGQIESDVGDWGCGDCRLEAK